MRTLPVAAAMFAVVLGVPLAAGRVASASPRQADPATEFVQRVNSLRVSHGLEALSDDGELSRIAGAWTAEMAQAGHISHNPSLATEVRTPWLKLGENVGRGGDADDIEDAFEASPGHLRNIMDPAFDSMAITVVQQGDLLYVTEEFRQSPHEVASAVPDQLAATGPTPSLLPLRRTTTR